MTFKYPAFFGTPKEYYAPQNSSNYEREMVTFDHFSLSTGIYYDALNKRPTTIGELYSQNPNRTRTTVDGKDAIRISTTQDGTFVHVQLSDGKIVSIQYGPTDTTVLDQILTTLKFIP